MLRAYSQLHLVDLSFKLPRVSSGSWSDALSASICYC